MDSQPLSRPTHHHITPITCHSHHMSLTHPITTSHITPITRHSHHMSLTHHITHITHHTSLTHHITPPPQVYCSLPAGAEEVEEEMIKETVKRECCQQTYWRITSNSLKVVSGGREAGRM